MPLAKHAELLVGLETGDDAAVYRLQGNLALVQTVDFFTPIVDDPYAFGQIAAANALSDIYAMGGVPFLALNVVCFPVKKLGTEILAEILRGGAEKVAEAGAVLAGGHTVEDDVPKYGLAVSGTVPADAVLTNATARPGNRLVLTKPLGTGVITTAIKADMCPVEVAETAITSMRTLNAAAAGVMREVGIEASTDVTGFGLLGHALEMAVSSGVGLRIEAGAVPLLPGARELAQMGLLPGGAHANARHVQEAVRFAQNVPPDLRDLFADPQTSGGLLMAVTAEKAEDLLHRLHAAGVAAAAIGEVTDETGIIEVA